MPWLDSKISVSAALLLLGGLLAAGNLWFAAQRSTIPMRLLDRIKQKEIRREKHPGKDDVLLLHMESGSVLHVDRPVFEALREGDEIAKEAWSRQLRYGNQQLALGWSQDTRGMARGMPAVLVVLMATAAAVYLADRRRAAEQRPRGPIR